MRETIALSTRSLPKCILHIVAQYIGPLHGESLKMKVPKEDHFTKLIGYIHAFRVQYANLPPSHACRFWDPICTETSKLLFDVETPMLPHISCYQKNGTTIDGLLDALDYRITFAPAEAEHIYSLLYELALFIWPP